MLNISISEEIADKCPKLQVLAITCLVKNTNSDENLWKEIVEEERLIRDTVKLDQINKWLPIQATRQAYKCFGKDPNRYRPSAESLRRRILRELPLYKVDTLVDLINLVSIRSGYSIGGFDLDKIEGEQLVLGVGKEGELYHGIGRGELNIAGLPVYRDKIGGIGTPTSDEERTKISLETSRLLMIINGYSGNEGLMDAGKYAITLLSKYVSAKNVEIKRITVDGVTDVVL
jgi:DNA/RNA-binding domain of Phe-tRNA-synthetase-like protein